MPTHNRFDPPDPSARRREVTSAALEAAYQLRKELVTRPLPPPDLNEQPIHELVHFVREDLPQDRVRTAEPPSPWAAQISYDELKRLRRIVNLLTTAMGELNLWLANAGQQPVEIDP